MLPFQYAIAVSLVAGQTDFEVNFRVTFCWDNHMLQRDMQPIRDGMTFCLGDDGDIRRVIRVIRYCYVSAAIESVRYAAIINAVIRKFDD